VTAPLWVVVPAYNEAGRIGDTLRALAAQTDTDFTLLVVDNGSTDETAALARAFPAPFPTYVIFEQAKGVGCAVDTGFRHAIAAGAVHLARTDADCLPAPGWVAAARRALASGGGLACGRVVARRDEHGPFGRMPRRPSPTDRTFLNRVRRSTTAIVHSRQMVVANSTRRIRAYGVVGTAKWYLDRGSGSRTADPR